MPLPIVEALAFHHHPGFINDRTFTPTAAVHIADALENRKIQGPDSLLDAEHLADLGLSGRVHGWQKIHKRFE